jgi:pimeloyl-ACP methyl ester carboxylesterase
VSEGEQLWDDLEQAATPDAPRSPKPLERLITWRHGIVPWVLILVALGIALTSEFLLARTPQEVVGWVLIGCGVLTFVLPPSGFAPRFRQLPMWWVVAGVLLHLGSSLLPRSAAVRGWLVLLDGLLLVTAVAIARRRVRRSGTSDAANSSGVS